MNKSRDVSRDYSRDVDLAQLSLYVSASYREEACVSSILVYSIELYTSYYPHDTNM